MSRKFFTPPHPFPNSRGGSKKFTNDLASLYHIKPLIILTVQDYPIARSAPTVSIAQLIICDRDEIAQFLTANNVYFENNCAILSISGYPQSIFNI